MHARAEDHIADAAQHLRGPIIDPNSTPVAVVKPSNCSIDSKCTEMPDHMKAVMPKLVESRIGTSVVKDSENFGVGGAPRSSCGLSG
jgi:hypothetical protein